MKYCLGCKVLVDRTLAVRNAPTQPLDAEYHWCALFVGSSDPAMIGCHQEQILCGPLRDLTEKEQVALVEFERLEHLLGAKL